MAEETGEKFGVVVCPGCGLGRTDPIPADLDPYYTANYYGNRHGWTARLCVRRRLNIVRQAGGRAAGQSLLDYGSGDGRFALAARSEGWHVTGVERQQPDQAGFDFPVVCDLAELAGRPLFDRATFWHVLEHLHDPVAVLTRLRHYLSPQAVVVAAVPHFGSWQARATGSGWLHLDIPRHLFHFTRRSMTLAFLASGYDVEILRQSEWEYDVMGWSQGLLNRFLGGRNQFFQVMSGRPHLARSAGTAVQVAAGLGLAALAGLPAWVEGRIGQGGTLIAVARPGGIGETVMHDGKKIVVVMPAYNAEATLHRTYQEIDRELVDEVILVDDASRDRTAEIGRSLGLHVLVHPVNRGYGGNQKTCYAEALRLGADIVVMVHPDYQYTRV